MEYRDPVTRLPRLIPVGAASSRKSSSRRIQGRMKRLSMDIYRTNQAIVTLRELATGGLSDNVFQVAEESPGKEWVKSSLLLQNASRRLQGVVSRIVFHHDRLIGDAALKRLLGSAYSGVRQNNFVGRNKPDLSLIKKGDFCSCGDVDLIALPPEGTRSLPLI